MKDANARLFAESCKSIGNRLDRQREALEEISRRCPPYTGGHSSLSEIADEYSGTGDSQGYAEECDAFLSAQIGDIARQALS